MKIPPWATLMILWSPTTRLKPRANSSQTDPSTTPLTNSWPSMGDPGVAARSVPRRGRELAVLHDEHVGIIAPNLLRDADRSPTDHRGHVLELGKFVADRFARRVRARVLDRMADQVHLGVAN